LSVPRMTILSVSSGSGRCNAFASSRGARIKASTTHLNAMPSKRGGDVGRQLRRAVVISSMYPGAW
jgi:hypothetical protein